MYHNFFIHSSVDGHLGCFCILATVNSTATNTGIYAPNYYALSLLLAFFLLFYDEMEDMHRVFLLHNKVQGL